MVDIYGGGKEVHDCVQKHLNALVLVAGTAEHGRALHGYGSLSETPADLVGGEFHGLKEFFHELVVAFGSRFHYSHVGFFGSILHICGDLCLVVLLAVVRIVNFGVHFNEVDDAFEGIFLADGQFDGNGIGVEPVLHHLYGAFEVCAVDIHLVDVSYAGYLVLIRLAPYRFGLGFYAALGAERSHGAVENAQRTLDFYGEVDVTRRVDDVYSAFICLGLARAGPVAGGCGGGDGYTPLLLLHHPVHRGSAVVRFAYLVVDTGIVKDTFGCSSLAGVDVSHDADISCMR